VICEHALTEFCSCIPRRPTAYVAEPVEMRPTGERIPPWQCLCVDPWTNRRLRKGQRHRDAIACQPQEDVEAFKAAHGIKDEGLARALRFIEGFRPR
jgi:hypothetical protein